MQIAGIDTHDHIVRILQHRHLALIAIEHDIGIASIIEDKASRFRLVVIPLRIESEIDDIVTIATYKRLMLHSNRSLVRDNHIDSQLDRPLSINEGDRAGSSRDLDRVDALLQRDLRDLVGAPTLESG